MATHRIADLRHAARLIGAVHAISASRSCAGGRRPAAAPRGRLTARSCSSPAPARRSARPSWPPRSPTRRAPAGARVAVFKPAVSGLDDHPLRPEVWESAPELPDHALLRLASGSGQGDDEIAPYRYGPPVSPHLAAELAGERIDPDRLRGRGARGDRGRRPAGLRGRRRLPGSADHRLPGPGPRAGPGAAGGRRRLAGAGDDQPHAAHDPGRSRRGPASSRPWCSPLAGRAVTRWSARTWSTIARLGSVAVETLPRLDLTAPRILAAPSWSVGSPRAPSSLRAA